MSAVTEVPLSDIMIKLESGSRPKGGVTKDSGTVPSLGGEHVLADGTLKSNDLKLISKEFFDKMKTGKIEYGDILIVKDGATTGKLALFTKDFPFKDVAINEHVFALRINRDKADIDYVFNFLKSAEGQRRILLDFRGATVGGISRDFVKKTKIPLPDLKTQRVISQKLNLANSLLVKRRQTIEKINSLSQAIFLEMFGSEIGNLKSSKKLAEVAVKITDGTHKTPKYMESGITFLSAKNVKENKLNTISPKYISIEEHQELIKRCKPEKGDLVLTKSGSLGDVAIVDLDIEFSIFESLALIKLTKEVNPTFMFGYLSLKATKEKLLRSTKGVGVKHLHLVDIRELPVFVPEIRRQNEFELRYKKVCELFTHSSNALIKSELLFDSLCTSSFGESK